MVYIDISNSAPMVFIPSHGWPFPTVGLVFTLKNTTDGSEVEVPITGCNRAGFLVRLLLRIPEGFYRGEWQYKLTGVDGYEATGLLMAYDGDAEPAPEYHGENNVIQYGG